MRLVTQRATLAIALLATAACSQRGCASCVGYAPEVSVAEFESVALVVDQTNRPLTVSLALVSDKDESGPCPSVPKTTTMSWNGTKITPELGEGHIRSTRGGDWTECRGARGSWGLIPPLGPTTPPDNHDRFEITDGASTLVVTLATGRPRVTLPQAGEAEIVFEGLEGKLDDLTTCIAPAADEHDCSTLGDRKVAGNRVRGRFQPKTKGAWIATGFATLHPTATCVPAKKSCTASVSYAIRAPFTVP